MFFIKLDWTIEWLIWQWGTCGDWKDQQHRFTNDHWNPSRVFFLDGPDFADVSFCWRQVASSKRWFVIFLPANQSPMPIFQWFFSGGWNGKVSYRIRFPWGWNRWITLNPELRRRSEMSIVGLCLWNIEKDVPKADIHFQGGIFTMWLFSSTPRQKPEISAGNSYFREDWYLPPLSLCVLFNCY